MADQVGGWVIDTTNPDRATYTDEDGFTHEAYRDGKTPTSAPTPTVQPQAAPVAQAPAPQINEERGAWQRLKDSTAESAQYGFPGWVARKWYDWSDYGIQDLIKKGYSPEEAETLADKLISQAQKGIREDYARKQEADPNWKPDETFWQAAGQIDKWGPWLAGQLVGSAGPESLVNPGAGPGARIAAQIGMGGASDAAYQAADITDEVADEFNTSQMLTSAAMGGGLQSAFEVPGFIRDLFKKRGVDTNPDADPRVATKVDQPMDVEVKATETLKASEYSPEELKQYVDSGEWKQDPANPDQLIRTTDEEYNARIEQNGEEVIQASPAEAVAEAPVGRTKADLAAERGIAPDGTEMPVRAPEENLEPTAPERVTPEMSATLDRVNTITQDWKDAPKIEVFEDFKDIDGVEPNWVGFVGDDGIVRINSTAAKTPSMVDAVVFHEALGHYGLTKEFGDGLDKLMLDLYDSNPTIRAKADAYGERFPTTYADADVPTARHVEEVLAEMSEAGQLTPTMRGRIVRFLKELGRKMGVNIKYTDAEIKHILSMAHSAVVNGKSVPENGFRLFKPKQGDDEPVIANINLDNLGVEKTPAEFERDMFAGRKAQADLKTLMNTAERGSSRNTGSANDNRPMQRTARDEDEMTLIGSINPSRIKSKYDIEEILEGLVEEAGDYTPVSREQTMAEAKAMGINASKMLKGEGDVGNLSAKVYAARQVMTAQLNKVAKLQEKMATDGYSEALQADFIKALTTLRAVHASVSQNASELGRALASLRMMSDGKMSAAKIIKAMQEQGNDLLGNPEQFKKFAATLAATADVKGELAAIKMARDSFKHKAEDYIFSAWYNMLLSSPATHVVNFVGTGGNFAADMMFATGAALKGQFGRNADRIRAREIGYRMWGALSALRASSDTWANTRRVLNGAEASGTKTEKAQHVLGGDLSLGKRVTIKGAGDFASGVFEAPSRALAGADEFWKNVLQLSDIHGMAVRNAGRQGLKGKEFWNRTQELIDNPTDEMLAHAADYSKVLQFQDKASAIGKAIIDLQTPKADSSVPGRVARGIVKIAVPFVRTPDALIRTALRYTPLGVFERENIKGWKAGGAERDKVKARLIMGSAISFWLATEAMKGNITGVGPSDSKKKQEWLAGHQENSVKVGDKYYSIAGLEPVSTVINGIATLVERGKAGEISDEDYVKTALNLSRGIGTVLTENAYTEGLNNLMAVTASDPDQGGIAFTNFIAGLASSATTPAILRKYTQATDPVVRDTTGDGSLYDRIIGRVKSGLPGLSEQLPERYDIYGKSHPRDFAGPDLASRTNIREVESDPALKELIRLAETTDKVVVGAPGKNVKVDGAQRRLTAEEFQKYQYLSGYWIVESTREEMKTPEWQTGDDAYKLGVMKEITEDMRKAARELLFDPEDEEPEDVTGDDPSA